MSDQCAMCGMALSAHSVAIRDGVAHTVVYDTERRPWFCSDDAAGRAYLRGEINRLLVIIRSLRNRAGRLRNADALWDYDDLLMYAEGLVRERERLIGYETQYGRRTADVDAAP